MVGCHLARAVYECIADPTTRGKARSAQGFCRTRAWQLRRQSGALGIDVADNDVVKGAIHALEVGEYRQPKRLSPQAVAKRIRRSAQSAATAAVVQALQPRAPCQVCATQRQAEVMHADVLLDGVGEAWIRAIARAAGAARPVARGRMADAVPPGWRSTGARCSC